MPRSPSAGRFCAAYRPQTVPAEQFEKTNAPTPLPAGPPHGVPEAYPFGL